MSDWYVDTHIGIARVYRKRINTHRCFIMSMMYVRNLVDLHLKYYYSDYHDVDEDRMIFTGLGGEWWRGSNAGITHRFMVDSSTDSHDVVAYKYNKNSTPVMRVEF